MLSAFAITLVPAVTKAVLKIYVGEEAAGLAGTSVSIALKAFADRSVAYSAEREAKRIAGEISSRLEAWLEHEGNGGEAIEVWAAELADVLDSGFSERLIVQSALDADRLASVLIDGKQDDWQLAGESIHSMMPRLTQEACRLLTRIAPQMPAYGLERDRHVLAMLEVVSGRVSEVLSASVGVEAILAAIESRPREAWHAYESNYLQRITEHLNYVEILGLGLKREHRKSNLSVAYLSLTLGGAFHSEEIDERLSFEDLLAVLPWRGNRLMIEGGAGSGKSTLLRWTAIRCARPSVVNAAGGRAAKDVFADLLGQPDLGGLSRQDNKLLTSVRTRLAGSNGAPASVPTPGGYQDQIAEAGFHAPLADYSLDQRVPFLIRLRDVKGKELPKIEEFSRTLFDLGPPPDGWVNKVLSEGRAVILFDGLDEISEDSGARSKILAQIRSCSDTYPNAMMIIAGRPGAFVAPPFGDRAAVAVAVNDMDDSERRDFVDKWHKARAVRERNSGEQRRILDNAPKLQHELENNSALRRMASNPLLAASICALHDINPSTTPRNEYDLCERLAKMLVSERDSTDDEEGGRVDLLELGKAYSLDYPDKRTIISKIAGQMIRNGESVLSWDEAFAVVSEAIHRLNRPEGVQARSLLKALAIRSGVLRRAISHAADGGEEALEFVHNRFKEWFASINILDVNQPTELANHLPADPYDQVAVFAVSAAGSEDFSDRLLGKVRDRLPIRSSDFEDRQLKLAAVRINEAARALSPDLKRWAMSLNSEMFPPRNRTEAKILSLLGDGAVPYLTRKRSWGAREAAAAAVCLRLIGTPAAMTKLEGYLVDQRWTVGQEVSLSLDPLRSAAFVARMQSGGSLGRFPLNNVNSLRGLTFSPQLIKLSRSSLSALDNPPALRLTKILELGGTPLQSLKGIEGAHRLEVLDISSTKVTDLSPVLGLPELKSIDLSKSGVTNLSALETLPKLSKIIAQNMRLEQASLYRVSQAQYLDVHSSAFSELQFIETWSGLQYLGIGSTAVTDLSPLVAHSDLNYLVASRLPQSAIATLPILPSLRSLWIPDTDVRSLEEIVAPNLTWLMLDRTKITSLKGLENFPNLTRIDLDSTEVTDLSPLLNLKNLESVFVKGLSSLDFTTLYALPKLKWLGLANGVNVESTNFSSGRVRVTKY